MKTIALIVLAILSGAPLAAKDKPPVQYEIPLPAKPDFVPVEWLVGEWAGKTLEKSTPGEVHLSAAFDLEGRFIILRGELSLSATKTAPATKESWMGILAPSPDRVGFVLRTFSSTGFMARYRVTIEGAEVHFNPAGGEEIPVGWLFRRVLQRTGADEFTETVQVAPPNKSFFDYYTAKFSRVPPANKNAAGH